MDLSLRIQTPATPTATTTSTPVQSGGVDTCAHSNGNTTNLSDLNPSQVQSTALPTSNQLGSIVINNNINGLQTAPGTGAQTNTQTGSNNTTTTPKEDWVKSMMTEMKTMFDGFLSSMTKLLETFLGKKPADTTTGNTNQTSSPTQNTSNGTTSTGETFAQRTVKNMGEQIKSKISEESMREYVLMYQLYQKDSEAESLFKSSLEKNKASGMTSDSAIKKSLVELENSGKLQRWESDWIYALSSKASQFDNDQFLSQNKSLSGDAAIKAAEGSLIRIATGVDVPAKMQIA